MLKTNQHNTMMFYGYNKIQGNINTVQSNDNFYIRTRTYQNKNVQVQSVKVYPMVVTMYSVITMIQVTTES